MLQFGLPLATDDQMWEALRTAQATDFIEASGGLDMVVQQDGANFSGGQRQRLAIARTLIKETQVYVFDDSFSALDFETDSRVRGQFMIRHVCNRLLRSLLRNELQRS